MTPADELRQDIRRAAAAKGHHTQAEMATAIGMSTTYMCDILLNRKRLTPDLVKRAAEAFEIHPVRYRRWHRLGAMESGWEIDTRKAPAAAEENRP